MLNMPELVGSMCHFHRAIQAASPSVLESMKSTFLFADLRSGRRVFGLTLNFCNRIASYYSMIVYSSEFTPSFYLICPLQVKKFK